MCRSKKVTFHTDAAQAVGKIPLDVNDLKIDVMSISGHKIYGPKGNFMTNTIIYNSYYTSLCTVPYENFQF